MSGLPIVGKCSSEIVNTVHVAHVWIPKCTYLSNKIELYIYSYIIHYGNEIIKMVNEVGNSKIPQCKIASLNGI